MNIWDILLIGFGLAMDAFAISVCKGLTMPRRDWKKTLIIAAWFGIFQAGMPLLGWLLGARFSAVVASVDHWIAFVLLSLIGGNMIREALHPDEDTLDDDVSFRVMLPLAVATSIDALVTGVTFAFMSVSVWLAVSVIGGVTFVLCIVGVLLGRVLGNVLKDRARLLGGIVLILMGLKILIEHLTGAA